MWTPVHHWLLLVPQENKRKRTFDNFYTFCSFVLEYEEKLVSLCVCVGGGGGGGMALLHLVGSCGLY